MDHVRIGIIGYGGMGSSHARYLTAGEVPHASLTAVCDVNPARLDAAQQQWGDDVARYDDAEKLITAGVCDAVIIATPHYFHPPIGVQAFGHGLHVLSEKPAGVYTQQVRILNETAEASGLIFALMFNQRCRGVHRKMRDVVASGELGELYRTNWIITSWFRTQAYYDSGGWRATWAGEGGGVLINQCPHNLDLWQWIAGLPKRVRAFCGFGKYHDIEVEDDVTAYVEYDNGATGVFVTTTGEAPGTNRFEVVGDRGKLVLEGGELTFWRTRESTREFLQTSPGGFSSPEVWQCEIPGGRGNEEHKGVTRAFVDAIRAGDSSKLIADGREGIRSLELSNAMHLSAWTGETIEIPVDEERYLSELQKRSETSRYHDQASEDKVMDVEGTF